MRVILEKEAEKFLENHKFNVVKRHFITKKNELSKIKINFPWVMKVSSPKVIHKSKSGGVILGIKTIREAEKAFDKLRQFKGFDGVMIQEKGHGQEIILGIKNTPEFGHVIMVGSGGTNVEEKKDVTFRIPPLTKKDSESMIKDLKIKINNSEILSKEIIKLSKLSEKNPKLQELDMNPIFISKKEATVVDARAVFV